MVHPFVSFDSAEELDRPGMMGLIIEDPLILSKHTPCRASVACRYRYHQDAMDDSGAPGVSTPEHWSDVGLLSSRIGLVEQQVQSVQALRMD